MAFVKAYNGGDVRKGLLSNPVVVPFIVYNIVADFVVFTTNLRFKIRHNFVAVTVACADQTTIELHAISNFDILDGI